MKHLFLRILIIASVTSLLGNTIDNLADLETRLGLDTLFKIRGIHQPPSEVVVVAMDESSETRLKVGQDLTRWRGFHANLIKELERQGVALVVFDLQFVATQAEHDTEFAAAIRNAGNVLISNCVQKLRRGVEDFYGRDECSDGNQLPFVQKEGGQHPLSAQLIAMRIIKPNSVLNDAVLDHAPFYLTNDADNATIREGWTFLDTLAEAPTLPVVAWFHYLQRTGAITATNQPISAWLTEQRRQCLSSPMKTSKHEPGLTDLQRHIDNIICLESARFLDFYGPPKTFRIESYCDVYEGKVSDLRSKIVFVGKANRTFSPGKMDFFQTPFTNTQSGRMSGVEIMATQFANLMENRFIEARFPFTLWFLAFGLVVALLLTFFAGITGIALGLLFLGAYMGMAAWCFGHYNFWIPIAVPLLIQFPVASLISLLWSRRDLLKERQRILDFIRRVFPQWIHFVPTSPGHWDLDKNTEELEFGRDVYGLCLATDIEGYTTVAAQHTPHEMWELLNAYYQVLGHPVISHDGMIADVTGDAMMSVWIDLPIETQRLSACLAALEMGLGVGRFNETSKKGRLPTRIGLYEGDMTLGVLNAGEGKNFRAIGNTVNTASRIQGVNKYLGTQILASAAIVANLTNIIYRPVGNFCLVGQEEPVELMEIVGTEAEVSAIQKTFYEQFTNGLRLFQLGNWEDAINRFKYLLDSNNDDGVSRFYLKLSIAYQKNPPQDWHGIVTLEGK